MKLKLRIMFGLALLALVIVVLVFRANESIDTDETIEVITPSETIDIDESTEIKKLIALEPKIKVTSSLAGANLTASDLESNSLLHRITLQDFKQSALLQDADEVELDKIRQALRTRIGIRPRQSSHQIERELLSDRLEAGFYVRYRELKFDVEGHTFVVYQFTPADEQAKPFVDLPIVMSFMGQQDFFQPVVIIPGIDFSQSMNVQASNNINGTLVATLIVNGLADVYVPSFIVDSKTRVALNRLLLLSGSSLAATEVEKSTAVLEYALSQEYVNKERVVVTGVSMGGQNGLLFTALEPRVKALVLNGWAPDLSDESAGLGLYSKDRVTDPLQPEEIYLPGLLEFGDANLLYRLLVPRPALIVSGKKDDLYPVQASYKMYLKLKSFYKGLNHPDNLLAFKISNQGHTVDTEAVLPWLKEFFQDGSQLSPPPGYQPEPEEVLSNTREILLTDEIRHSYILTNDNVNKTNVTVDENSYPGFFLHAPSEISWELQILPGQETVFKTYYGIIDNMRELSDDGVEFVVRIREDEDDTVVFRAVTDPRNNPEDNTYEEAAVDLTPYAGKTIILTLASLPRGNNVADHFYVINPRLATIE